MSNEEAQSIEVAPEELGEVLSVMRLCAPKAQAQMRLSLSTCGQLTPVQAFRMESRLELFDGLKRLRAARELGWPRLRVEVHALESAGAKVRVLRCNAGAGLTELEEAWLVRSLCREDGLRQAQVALLLGRDKSWVCRRLALAEDLSDGVTASVRLGLLSATAAAELGRLQRCNQDAVAEVVARRGLTTRQTGRLIEALLAVSADQWPRILGETALPVSAGPTKSARRRTPGEQLVADAWTMKRQAVRLQTRLLERSLESLGDAACALAAKELVELRAALAVLSVTLDGRLAGRGASHAAY